ncbi:MAG: glycoside hydrolase family 95 protein [Armatimonas sp.]
MKLWYTGPAAKWDEALPIGNGTIAAMVFGGAEKAQFQLNHADLWAGGPHDYAHSGAAAALPEIRRLIFAGDYAAAQRLADQQFMSQPLRQKPYQILGNLWIVRKAENTANYRRELDLDAGITRSPGIEAFASHPDGVIVIHLTGADDVQLQFDSPHARNTVRQEGDTWVLAGQSDTVKFEARAQVRKEGRGNVTILLAMATSYKNWQDVSGDPTAQNVKTLERVAKKSYAVLKKAHTTDYQKLYNRTALDLGPQPEVPTDARIKDFARGKDPQLAALHFAFGRYLLISCSRPGGRPATLQGLWNDSLTPPWDSKYTININTEMNYWPAGPANLLECYEPLFGMLEEMAETGKSVAKVHYGAGGWVCHHNTDGWRGTAPVDGAYYGIWPMGGAWLCKSIKDYYDFTGDDAMLARLYPVLRGAAWFFVDALVSDPATGELVTCPSNSPENAHHRNVSICAGPAMDSQILRDLFDAVIFTAKKLDKDAAFQDILHLTRAKLPKDRIGKGGQLQEWREDWDLEAPEPNHRHVSHLYGLFPSAQINPDATPALAAAAKNSLERRGDMSTGWSLAWKLNLWARLREGERAYTLLTGLLTPQRTAPNLFDLHPPFQIDGNFGAVSGVCELLLQSHTNELHLLPALPKAWPQGSVRGLLARGGTTVDLEWSGGKLATAYLKASKPGAVTVRVGEERKTVTLRANRRTRVI